MTGLNSSSTVYMLYYNFGLINTRSTRACHVHLSQSTLTVIAYLLITAYTSTESTHAMHNLWTSLPFFATKGSQVEATDDGRRRTSLLTPFIVLGSVSLLPYLLVRARVVSLQKQLEEVARANRFLRQDVKALLSEVSSGRTEQQRFVGAFKDTQGSIERLSRQAERGDTARVESENKIHQDLKSMRQTLERLEADAAQRDCAHAEWQNICRDDIKSLLHGNERTSTHLSAITELGTPLANIAAFMHEVEVRHGYPPRKDDGRGIERLRRLAKKFQELGKSDSNSNCPR
ncbi:hypothetical protein AcW1_004814 [Taiwanofungus camphoratus]|nr:hypothetical protein AcW2_006182 [Antrodia cinnamomea]KAI0938102.1 hypothetical protein AcV7_003387 [Antrodia cinnamomea]KAI0939962.1 hypothetical protein AcV5_001198 [Antrodia cinnamomea]KAI0960248.1 hypothetical protein AcW1_004814 [Antrodia cinnamomea]